MQNIDKLIEIIKNSDNIVFFGGAGVSTESGIPDFRSTDGIYNQKYEFQPEIVLSGDFFWKNTKYFYNFYKDKMIYLNAKPNVTHNFLYKLEKANKLRAVITQNIDNLHELSGSKNVLHLHGSIYKNKCTKCGKIFPIDKVMQSEEVPVCECGGIIKPQVVLYGEALPESVVYNAIKLISDCEVLIVGGTSLTVYPAAMYVDYFKGKHLILINKDKTNLDTKAELVFHNSLGEIYSILDKEICL